MSLKTVFVIGVWVCSCISLNAQTGVINPVGIQTDSSEIVYNQIIAGKAKYIGQPMSVLFNDIKFEIDFSSPDNQGSKLRGQAYFKRFSLYIIGPKEDAPLRIRISNKVFVDLQDMVDRRKDGTWVKKLKALLKNEIVVALE